MRAWIWSIQCLPPEPYLVSLLQLNLHPKSWQPCGFLPFFWSPLFVGALQTKSTIGVSTLFPKLRAESPCFKAVYIPVKWGCVTAFRSDICEKIDVFKFRLACSFLFFFFFLQVVLLTISGKLKTHWFTPLDCNSSSQCLTLGIKQFLCRELGISWRYKGCARSGLGNMSRGKRNRWKLIQCEGTYIFPCLALPTLFTHFLRTPSQLQWLQFYVPSHFEPQAFLLSTFKRFPHSLVWSFSCSWWRKCERLSSKAWCLYREAPSDPSFQAADVPEVPSLPNPL